MLLANTQPPEPKKQSFRRIRFHSEIYFKGLNQFSIDLDHPRSIVFNPLERDAAAPVFGSSIPPYSARPKMPQESTVDLTIEQLTDLAYTKLHESFETARLSTQGLPTHEMIRERLLEMSVADRVKFLHDLTAIPSASAPATHDPQADARLEVALKSTLKPFLDFAQADPH